MITFSDLIVPVVFLSFWLFMSYWLSEMSGWRYLAQKYPNQKRFSGEKIYFQSLGMQQAELPLINRGSYGNCITIGLDQDGVSLFILPFFRFAHPPIYVPWQDVAMQVISNQVLWRVTFVKVSFAKSDIAIYISHALAQKICQVSNLSIAQALN